MRLPTFAPSPAFPPYGAKAGPNQETTSPAARRPALPVLGRRLPRILPLLTVFLLLAGIGSARAQDAAQETATGAMTLLALGDSLTAGYNLPQDAAFPVKLEAALRAEGLDVRVINAGVSGDTSAGGRARLDWALQDDPDGVIVELGANDGLRGIDPANTRENLDAIVTTLKDRGIPVLLAGMRAPPNLGREYEAEFNPIYGELAKAHDLLLYPFFLEGIALKPELNQADGIHPTPEGVDVIVRSILPQVKALLDRARTSNAPGSAPADGKS